MEKLHKMNSIKIYLSLLFLFSLPVKAQNINWKCKVFRSLNEKNKITTYDVSFNEKQKTINFSIKATGLERKNVPIIMEDKYKSKGWLIWRDSGGGYILDTNNEKLYHTFYGINDEGKCKRR